MENTTNNQFTVTGLFNDKDSAECAYDALSGRGYSKDDVDVMMSDATRDKYYSGDAADDTELGSKAAEGAGVGSAIGGTLGAIIGGIAAIGTSILLPGLGLIVAGPLAAALVGAGAGGLTGGLLGALIGSGIPEEHAEAYESGIKSGGIVLRANPRTAEDAEARNSITVTLNDLSKVGATIDAATQAGANNIDGVSFTLRQDRTARGRALAEATREAIAKANTLAQALGGRVVRIVAVQEGGANFPHPVIYAQQEIFAAAKVADTPIEVGTLEINSQVQLVAEIEMDALPK
jgi:hypothetical protein